jgi:hypothetical protein
MRRLSLVPIVLTCLVLLAGCDDDAVVTPQEPDTVRASFQDGVLPEVFYHGTADAVLKNGPHNGLRNGNFGAAPSDTLGSVLLSSDFFERRLVIKMDLSSIKDCSQVLSASLSIRIAPTGNDPMTLEAHRIVLPDYSPWVEGFGGLAYGVSWTTIDGAAPWTAEGGDFDSSVIDRKTVSSDAVVTFSLRPDLVKSWILRPASNHGVVVKTTDVSRELFAIVFLREFSTAARRPRLDVTYLKGG